MSKNTEKTLAQLFWPCFFETLLLTLVGIIDVIMVSMVGDVAVAAVGTANTYLTMIGTLLTIVSYGALTVMTQYIGAGKPEVAYKAKNVGLIINLAIGGFFSLLFLLFSAPLLKLLSTSQATYSDAVTYITTVGASCILLAITNVYSAFLRSYGHARLTLVSATVGNAVNILLNYIFIKAGMGVFGIALGTFIARCVTMLLSMLYSTRIHEGKGIPCSRSSRELFRDIMRIGTPSACESTLFYLCTSAVLVCINRMDTEGIAAGVYSYCNQFAMLIYCVPIAVSQANAIIVGWRIGEGRFDDCMKQTKVSFVFGVAVSTVVSLICLALGRPLIGLLTDNAAILDMVVPVMAVNVIREFGRTGNNVYGMGLKAAGDAVSTLLIGVPVMPLCAFIGGWLLGLHFGYGIIGAWIGIALDEFIRFFMMLMRWKSRAWQQKALVHV